MVLRIIRQDKVIEAIQNLIIHEIGSEFVNPPPFDLELSFKDSESHVPIVFILSPGADPIAEIKKLALKKGFQNKWTPMSLGDGQGAKAENAIDNAVE
jgi:dynein heavy chain